MCIYLCVGFLLFEQGYNGENSILTLVQMRTFLHLRQILRQLHQVVCYGFLGGGGGDYPLYAFTFNFLVSSVRGIVIFFIVRSVIFAPAGDGFLK